MTSLIPLLTALVAVIAGAIAYVRQRRIDREHQLMLDRRAAYRDFLNDASAFVLRRAAGEKFTTEEFISLFQHRVFLACIASDHVVSAAKEFGDLVRNYPDDKPDLDMTRRVCESLATLLLARRLDCFEGSKLSKEDFGASLPFMLPD